MDAEEKEFKKKKKKMETFVEFTNTHLFYSSYIYKILCIYDLRIISFLRVISSSKVNFLQ